MPRFAYVDGRFVRHREGVVHIEDRGLQFGDAIYEVCAVKNGILFDMQGHLARLARSLSALSIPAPLSDTSLLLVMRELMVRNKLANGLVYLQISRGVAARNHAFPKIIRPSIVLTARTLDMRIGDIQATTGISVQSHADIRWGRVDIKTINLLPNVLAKQAAIEAGFGDAWLVDANGYVTEGTAQNAWIVDASGILRTRASGHDILRGITRDTIIKVARDLGYELEERAFTLEEAKVAREAFVTSATSFVTPVIRIDDVMLGDGMPGNIAKALRTAYLSEQTSVK